MPITPAGNLYEDDLHYALRKRRAYWSIRAMTYGILTVCAVVAAPIYLLRSPDDNAIAVTVFIGVPLIAWLINRAVDAYREVVRTDEDMSRWWQNECERVDPDAVKYAAEKMEEAFQNLRRAADQGFPMRHADE